MKIATEASAEFFDWALLDALHIEQANPDPHLDDLQLLHALEQREDQGPRFVKVHLQGEDEGHEGQTACQLVEE